MCGWKQSHVQRSGGDPSSSDSTADWQVKWIEEKTSESAFQTHDGSMVLLYMVLHGSHQYTPNVSIYNIYHTWILKENTFMKFWCTCKNMTWFSNMGTRRATGRAVTFELRESEVTMRSSRSSATLGPGGPRTWHSASRVYPEVRDPGISRFCCATSG